MVQFTRTNGNRLLSPQHRISNTNPVNCSWTENTPMGNYESYNGMPFSMRHEATKRRAVNGFVDELNMDLRRVDQELWREKQNH